MTRRTLANKTRYPRLYRGRPCRIVRHGIRRVWVEFYGGARKWVWSFHLRKRYMEWIAGRDARTFTGDILYPGEIPSEPQHVNCRCVPC